MLEASVIINTYNGNQVHLIEAVNSCLKQKDVSVQLIISTVKGDSSIKTLKDYNVEFIENDHSGIYYQLNNAIKKIKKEWFCYASGDDLWLETKLKNEITLCKDNSKKICYSSFIHGNEVLRKKFTAKFHDYNLEKHLKGNFIADVSTINTKLLLNNMPFDESLGNFAYWDLWLRIALKDPNQFIYNPNPEWIYRVYSNSRHIKRAYDKNKRLENEKSRLLFLQKNQDTLKKYSSLNLLHECRQRIDLIKKER